MENPKTNLILEECGPQAGNTNSMVNTWIKGMTPMGRRKEDMSDITSLNTSAISHQQQITSRSPIRKNNPKNTTSNKENTTPKNTLKIKGKKENIMVLVGKEKSPGQMKKNPVTPRKNTPRAANNQPQVFRSPTAGAAGGASVGGSKMPSGRFFPNEAQALQQISNQNAKAAVEHAMEQRNYDRPASDYFEKSGGDHLRRETFHSKKKKNTEK